MLCPTSRLFGRRFFAFFALLAMFAQSVVAVAPLAEGRDRADVVARRIAWFGVALHAQRSELRGLPGPLASRRVARDRRVADRRSTGDVSRPAASPPSSRRPNTTPKTIRARHPR